MRPLAFLKILLAWTFAGAGVAAAAAPQVLHTAGYEGPVRGDPGDLLMIAGDEFNPTDRVVYEATTLSRPAGTHPERVPSEDTADLGKAPVVHIGDLSNALTVKLPNTLHVNTPYRLWVVTASGEWSRQMSINDLRPQWIAPARVYASADIADLGRRVRIIGRNLQPDGAHAESVRLVSTAATYVLSAAPPSTALRDYVIETTLPDRLAAGSYAISVSRDGRTWIDLSGQRLEVRPDPPVFPTFDLADSRFGGCRADDGRDDSGCLTRALEAAGKAHGGVIAVPPGTWDLSAPPGGTDPDGFVIPANVQLRGAGAPSSAIHRHRALERPFPAALLSLSGQNAVVGLSFMDDAEYQSGDEARAVIQLGTSGTRPTLHDRALTPNPVQDIVIADNFFIHVGRGITDTGRPMARLFIVRNRFGAYQNAIELPGNRFNTNEPYRIDDAAIRWNHFAPGSYIDVAAHQGTLASGLGASHRVDFSNNVADGASTEGLQNPADPKGWRAAFFWNTNNNLEQLLVADNRISCSGDKAGDGEAIALDGNGDTYAFNGAPAVSAAGPDWITANAIPATVQNGQIVDPHTYYNGHWIEVVDGPGLGQTRKIVGYGVRDTKVTFRVSPGWDVAPAARRSRIIVSRQFWQVYIVANQIDHASPPCLKSNRSGPNGGLIGIWGSSADSTIEGNHQRDSNGILFDQGYSVIAASCPTCSNRSAFQTALEIRGNVIENEYDWRSDCSSAGISAFLSASPTPESTPPIESLGVSIAHNSVSHSDGLRGGAIGFALAWHQGPPPHDWPLVQNPLIFGNVIRDVAGPPPGSACGHGQKRRVGIQLGTYNVRDAVLDENRCQNVDTFLIDAGKDSAHVCQEADADRCECSRR